MEKGNSSNSKNDAPNKPKLTRDMFWPTFEHFPVQGGNQGDYKGVCRKCHCTVDYNINEKLYDFDLRFHYMSHITGEDERYNREHNRKPARCDWYTEYLTPENKSLSEPITTLESKPCLYNPTPASIYEEIYNFRGDHTVSCTRCGEVLNYQEKILRRHYDHHEYQDYCDKKRRDLENQDRIREFYAKQRQEAEERKKIEMERNFIKNQKKWEIKMRKEKIREEQRKIAASKMAEIEQQQSDEAFWNEAAQMADNAPANQAQMTDNAPPHNAQYDDPWWDEIVQYADRENI